MQRVASLGGYLAKNWKTEINKTDIVQTLLFHDLENLLKFDLNRGVDLFPPHRGILTIGKKYKVS